MKKSYKNNKFKVSGPTWNEKFELHEWSYSVSDIPDYFEYIIKKHEIYINKIENRIAFKIKKEYYLQLLTPEMMKILGSTRDKII